MSETRRFAIINFEGGTTTKLSKDIPCKNDAEEEEEEESDRKSVDFSELADFCALLEEPLYTVESIVADLPDPADRLPILRAQFLTDFAVATIYARKSSDISIKALSERTALSRQAIKKILVSVEQPTGRKGPRLDTVIKLLSALDQKIILRLQSNNDIHNMTSASLLFVVHDTDPSALASQIVQQVRRVAGMTQAQLEQRLAKLRGKQPLKLAGYVSSIERQQDKKSIHLGTLFDMMFAAGFHVKLTAKETAT